MDALLRMKDCFLKGVIYRITCVKCQGTYIGSSIRRLHDRIKEHLNISRSSVYKYFSACQNANKGTHVNILTTHKNTINLRLKEAYHIRKEKPTINSCE